MSDHIWMIPINNFSGTIDGRRLVSIIGVDNVVESTEAERATASLNTRSDRSSSSTILGSTAHYVFHPQRKGNPLITTDTRQVRCC